jgi:hypothetical protein
MLSYPAARCPRGSCASGYLGSDVSVTELSQFQFRICASQGREKGLSDVRSSHLKCPPGLMPEHLERSHAIDKLKGRIYIVNN